jgi:4-hydroxy-tetrahydrodipicolinate synthase
MKLHGCITALVSPFRQGRLDLAGLKRNVSFQVRHRVAGLLVAGSTGEAPNLSEAEWERSLVAVREQAGTRVKVIAGTGTNSTSKSVRQVRKAEKLRADAALVVAPYYNKPSQEGMYRHFRTVAEATGLPIIIYNIPPRSVVNVLPATVERLAHDCRNIVAVKEASGSLDQATEIVSRCGDRIALLSGDDSLTLPILSVGGKGVISVASNIVPLDIVKMIEHYSAGEVEPAQGLHRRLFPLIKALFIESNPTPVKFAMGLLGMAAGEPRLPLVPPTPEHQQAIRQALQDYGLSVGST